MRNKLISCIAQIIYELAETGCFPDTIQKIKSNTAKYPFYLIIGPDSKKIVLVGIMLDYYDEEILKSYVIDVNKWNWASYEGFDIDGIFDRDVLYSQIFTELPVHRVSQCLA